MLRSSDIGRYLSAIKENNTPTPTPVYTGTPTPVYTGDSKAEELPQMKKKSVPKKSKKVVDDDISFEDMTWMMNSGLPHDKAMEQLKLKKYNEGQSDYVTRMGADGKQTVGLQELDTLGYSEDKGGKMYTFADPKVDKVDNSERLDDDSLAGLERIKQAIDSAGGAEYQDIFGAEMLDKNLAQKGVRSNVARVMQAQQKQSDMKGVLGAYTKALNTNQKNNYDTIIGLKKLSEQRYKTNSTAATKLAGFKNDLKIAQGVEKTKDMIAGLKAEGRAYDSQLILLAKTYAKMADPMNAASLTPERVRTMKTIEALALDLGLGSISDVLTNSTNTLE